jgi:signal transduction histidine kinase
MAYLQRLMPHSIIAQITGVVVISVLLGATLLVTIVWLLFDPPAHDDSPIFAAGRVTEITQLVRRATSPMEADALLAAIRRGGLEVKRVALDDLIPAGQTFSSRLAIRPLAMQPDIKLLNGLRDPMGPSSQIIVQLDEDHGLMFNLAINVWPIFIPLTTLLVMIVIFVMLLLSIYAVRRVVVPLAEVASAATSFGRSPQALKLLRRRGPREIIQVTDALNDMRIRISQLLDDRTRILGAISHDLRTPLTRLQLRAEQINQDGLRTSILRDLAKVSRMLNETLEYLRDNARPEPMSQIDLPSFLQTICSDFADMGHTVSYIGPARFSYACRFHALSRAVTNIVENAVKHGSTVSVALVADVENVIQIEISDDGPGIPAALRDKVFQPFFKIDGAKSKNGFGLGLSIAQDIIKRHGGDIQLCPGEPAGLRVLMVLPSKTSFQTI